MFLVMTIDVFSVQLIMQIVQAVNLVMVYLLLHALHVQIQTVINVHSTTQSANNVSQDMDLMELEYVKFVTLLV